MPRAIVMLRQQPVYRRESFVAGLRQCGYEIHDVPPGKIDPGDVLVIWNRYSRWHHHALAYERVGARVIVAENGYLGRDWRGEHWYAIARSHHNGAGSWHEGGPDRWDALNVPLREWREGGNEIVVLATRHIGPPGVAEPHGWSRRIVEDLRRETKLPVRVRTHPGEKPCVPLEQDLAQAAAVVTWGSGGALKALTWGIPVFYGFPKWIGGSAARRVEAFCDGPFVGDRLPMFHRLAWAMWKTDEIARGEPFRWLM